MKTTEKPKREIPSDPEEQAAFLRQIAKEIGDRDLYPEKTASARRFLEGLKKNNQTLFPK